jgi:hypothetical protein
MEARNAGTSWLSRQIQTEYHFAPRELPKYGRMLGQKEPATFMILESVYTFLRICGVKPEDRTITAGTNQEESGAFYQNHEHQTCE